MEKSDWHIFLAVVRDGSTLAASRKLRVSQSTVSRRIDALEAALGLKLFDRRSSGYVLTDSGAALVPKAEAIERAVADALTSARQQSRGLAGEIRFTTPAAFGQTFMVPALRDFRLAYPDIQVELVASEDLLDLGAGEADVALRAGPKADGHEPGGAAGAGGWLVGLLLARLCREIRHARKQRRAAQPCGHRPAQGLPDHTALGTGWTTPCRKPRSWCASTTSRACWQG